VKHIAAKYKLLLSALSLFLLFTSCQYLYSETKAKLVIDEPVYDFGNVEMDTILTHTFALANVGGDTLYIKGVRST